MFGYEKFEDIHGELWEQMTIEDKLKKNKYNANKVEYDGIAWDSSAEMEYYKLLIGVKNKEEIESFEIKRTFQLMHDFDYFGKKVNGISYTPDFVVYHLDGSVEAIEIKGFEARDWSLRKKLFMQEWNSIKLTVLKYTKKHGFEEESVYKKRVAAEKKARENKGEQSTDRKPKTAKHEKGKG